jgi:hypothetical protein
MISERNTKLFKDTIRTIISERNHTIHKKSNKLVHYNMTTKGISKPISISGTKLNDVIVYYWEDNNTNSHPIHYITESEYNSFKRDIKINEVFGVVTELVSSRKKSESLPAEFKVNVDDVLRLSHYHSNSSVIIVVSKTAKQFKFKFKYYGEEIKIARLDKYGRWSVRHGSIYNDVDNYDFNSESEKNRLNSLQN